MPLFPARGGRKVGKYVSATSPDRTFRIIIIEGVVGIDSCIRGSLQPSTTRQTFAALIIF